MSIPVQLLGGFIDECMEIDVPGARTWILGLIEELASNGEGEWERFRNEPLSRGSVCAFASVLRILVIGKEITSLPLDSYDALELYPMRLRQGHQFLQKIHRLASFDYGVELGLEDIDGWIVPGENYAPPLPKRR